MVLSLLSEDEIDMFCEIEEFAQTRDCVVHSRNPETDLSCVNLVHSLGIMWHKCVISKLCKNTSAQSRDRIKELEWWGGFLWGLRIIFPLETLSAI